MSLRWMVPALAASLWAAPALAHEGSSGHSHDDGPAPEPPAAQPDAAPMVQPAVHESPAPTAGVTAEVSGGTSRTAVAEPPPPEEDAGSYRPRSIPDTSWRQRVREGEESSSSRFVDANHFFFEIRFGPYFPEVDDDFGGDGPYTEFFGDGARFYFGLEVDYLPIYIPYVVSLGPGVGWGFTKASGAARTRADNAQVDGVDTSLSIFPMHVSAVGRFDGPLRELDIPIVPYAKIGLGFAPWSTSGSENDQSGTSGGMHLAIGGSIALNAFDPQTAMAMRADTGIRYAHVFGEWMYANLDTGLNVGTSTVIFGLALEL